MTDALAGQIITGVVTVLGFVFLWLTGRKRTRKAKTEQQAATAETTAAIEGVRVLVNGKHHESLRSIEALKTEVAKLNEDGTRTTPSGTAPGEPAPVTLDRGVVSTPHKEA
jgi:hypothetical protein